MTHIEYLQAQITALSLLLGAIVEELQNNREYESSVRLENLLDTHEEFKRNLAEQRRAVGGGG